MPQNDAPTDPSLTQAAPAPSGKPPELIGVGSPLIDFVVETDDAFLSEHVAGGKGGMQLVEAGHIHELIGKSGKEASPTPGGAAANTTVGCAHLGIRTAFIGSTGNDELGDFYHAALVRQNCEPRLLRHGGLPTGRVLSMVTADAERTMRTCLGAAAALDPAHFTAETFAGVRVVMLEGYTLFNHDLTRAIARAAKAAGAKLALDFASYEVVQANRAVLDELLSGQVDLMFANEDEAKAWNASGPGAALEELAARVPLVAVKLGKEGALLARGSERARIDAHVVDAIDTTGAGDCWAAGFLAGWLRDLPLAHCGRLGALSGAAVVQIKGAQLPRERWLGIKGFLDAWA